MLTYHAWGPLVFKIFTWITNVLKIWIRKCNTTVIIKTNHYDVIKWENFPRYWPFVRGTTGHRWFPSQRPVTRSFDVLFHQRLNKRLNKQSRYYIYLLFGRSFFEIVLCISVANCGMTYLVLWQIPQILNLLTHWGRDKMAAIFQTTFLKCIFLNENVEIPIKISLKFPMVQLTIIQHWFR